MNVHIAYYDDKHIVPRMMRHLSNFTGWTVNRQPRETADVNYFGPYLAWDVVGRGTRTKTAAWFTHYEVGTRGKIRAWHAAAEAVDLRVITTEIYRDCLQEYGPVARVVPGVQTDFFYPRNKRPGRNIVGLAGVCQRRKGPELLEALQDSDIDVSLIAAGIGWPIDHRWYDWNDIPDYYNGLDVFLCTSTIEGVPMPPLEALACGVKVVVPRGVGLMDELPEMTGIRHYDAGDGQDMLRALRTALDDDAPQHVLRSVVTETYTLQAWAESHERAMARL